MSEVLHISGLKAIIINSELNIQAGIFLSASFRGTDFNLREISAVAAKDTITSAVLRFDRADRRVEKGALNYIALSTNLRDTYKATGLSQLPGDSRKPEFHSIGDDLKIIVTPTAAEAIQYIRTLRREIEACRGRQEYLGFDPKLN